MSIVAGADFGTLSTRVTLMDTDSGAVLGSAVAPYPLHRSEADPHVARQSHDDQMQALCTAIRDAVAEAGIDGHDIAAFAADTTGSSVIPLDDRLQPLADYYLWCDHTAHGEADEITQRARDDGIEALEWCGGVYSTEWGYAKLLHFLRHNPGAPLATAAENCDMIAATLCGITDPAEMPRSVCAMGHKWMWGEAWGGLPPQEFLTRVDPALAGINDKITGRWGHSLQQAGVLSPDWAERTGMRAGIPLPFGAFDAHWDAIGTRCAPGDVVNVVGTSTCIIAISDADARPVPGICGMVPGSVVPGFMGIDAGQSATGDVFDAIARRAGSDVATLCEGLMGYGPCATGLLRVPWDNGDRTVLVRPDLGGVTLGWDLHHRAADEMHAAIEGMAMHVGLIIERMQAGGARFDRIINAGGIPQKNDVLNQVYADVLGRPVHVPERSPVGVGACIFAAMIAGDFETIAEAQERMAPPLRVFTPRASHVAAYERLSALFRDTYFAFGEGRSCDMGAILPALRRLRMGRG